jgi:hypothetical protein
VLRLASIGIVMSLVLVMSGRGNDKDVIKGLHGCPDIVYDEESKEGKITITKDTVTIGDGRIEVYGEGVNGGHPQGIYMRCAGTDMAFKFSGNSVALLNSQEKYRKIRVETDKTRQGGDIVPASDTTYYPMPVTLTVYHTMLPLD